MGWFVEECISGRTMTCSYNCWGAAEELSSKSAISQLVIILRILSFNSSASPVIVIKDEGGLEEKSFIQEEIVSEVSVVLFPPVKYFKFKLEAKLAKTSFLLGWYW